MRSKIKIVKPILLMLVIVGFLALAGAVLPAGNAVIAAENLFEDDIKLSPDEISDLSFFFSLFSAAQFKDYDINEANNAGDNFISFAIVCAEVGGAGIYHDDFERVDGWIEKIPADYIDRVVLKIFNVSNLEHRSLSWCEYKDGYYYYNGRENSIFSALKYNISLSSKVTDFYDNGNGTYSARMELYDTFEVDSGEFYFSDFDKYNLPLVGHRIAIVQPSVYSENENDVYLYPYQVLYWASAEKDTPFPVREPNNGDDEGTGDLLGGFYLTTAFDSNPQHVVCLDSAKEGGISATINIISQGAWTIGKLSNSNWITLYSKSGNGNGLFDFQIAPNTKKETRYTEVWVKCGNFTRGVWITQSGSSYINVITLEPELHTTFRGGTSSEVKIESNTNWTIASDYFWINGFTQKTGSGNATFTFDIDKNTSSDSRKGLFKVYGDGVTKIVYVNQRAMPPQIEAPTININNGDEISLRKNIIVTGTYVFGTDVIYISLNEIGVSAKILDRIAANSNAGYYIYTLDTQKLGLAAGKKYSLTIEAWNANDEYLPAESVVEFSTITASKQELLLDDMTERANAIVEYEWIPSIDIMAWNESEVFKKDTRVRGMPYTLWTSEIDGMTIDEHLLSLKDYKNVATKNYSNNAVIPCKSNDNKGRIGPMYGSCCATFVSEVWGVEPFMKKDKPQYHGVDNFTKETVYVSYNSDAKVSSIQAGDAMSLAGKHIIWVAEVTETDFVVYEQTPPKARIKIVSKTYEEDGYGVNKDGYLVWDSKVYELLSRLKLLIK